ncbi:MAG: acyl-CoA--6-aminopenicillanic acid acyl-transferase [Flavobacteriales bacterium]|nr:MAG: acyl-CoA--6-aminopenicillanic acid acyl-transferase [Flavobacteriales bacterium]
MTPFRKIVSFKSIFSKVCTALALLWLMASCGVKKSLYHLPDLDGYSISKSDRTAFSDTVIKNGANTLRKNKFGLWEMYLSGNALERGLAHGIMAKDLVQQQEAIFFNKVEEFVPSQFKQYLLRKFLAWYNRKLYLHISNEYQAEIYGISRYANGSYDYLATPFLRSLYLHAAHDIGHALQDLALVGCSSFAVWGDKTTDGTLLVARNFDFYAGDDFAKTKVVQFVQPDKGYAFASVSWPGMIGVVSGMNIKGLTVTINAGKSDLPLQAKTPISLVTREIIQYASNIEQAIAIAKNREVFVSEAILVSSAIDKKAVIIEVSPDNFGVYEMPNSSELICSNHFQSKAYKEDKNNNRHKAESHSVYRYKRMEELLVEKNKINPKKAAEILRDREGLQGENIGYGNEKALNQLLAHHGVIFKPEKLQLWVSAPPYQLGPFVGYDLHEVFDSLAKNNKVMPLYNKAITITGDSFIDSEAFKNYEEYRILSRQLKSIIREDKKVDIGLLEKLIKLNANYWEAHYLAGLYNYKKGYYAAAIPHLETSLKKEITTIPERKNVEHYLKKAKRKTGR